MLRKDNDESDAKLTNVDKERFMRNWSNKAIKDNLYNILPNERIKKKTIHPQICALTSVYLMSCGVFISFKKSMGLIDKPRECRKQEIIINSQNQYN